MTATDLSHYNLSELNALQHEIEVEIKNRQQQDVKSAREQILAIAQNVGVPIDVLLATTPKGPKPNKTDKVKPQYKNPADASQTWSGRGRQPKWIADGLASGKSLNDFRIQ